MARNDPAWESFRHVLKEAMATRDVSAAALAEALRDGSSGVDRQLVENWRRGSSTPLLKQLRPIAQALGLGDDGSGGSDPLYLLRQMGILDEAPASDVVVDTAYRLLKLQLKIEEADGLAAAAGRQGGAARVVQAAMQTGKWAVACWPAVEGPKDCRMRVADRIDIRRTDGGKIDNNQVWSDPLMKAALRSARAFPGKSEPRWAPTSDRKVSRWAISHVGAPKSPVVPSPKPDLLTMAFTATTVDSWVNDVASLVALLIGYGLSVTRDMAIEITGRVQHRDEDRNLIHDRYLREVPRCRVWSHQTSTGPGPFADSRGVANSQVFHVHLVESDELLRASAEARGTSVDQLRQASEDAKQQAARLRSERLILIPTEYLEKRDDRWQQVLAAVKAVYKRLGEQDLLPDDLGWVHQTQWLREHDIVDPLLKYLGLPRPVLAGPAHLGS